MTPTRFDHDSSGHPLRDLRGLDERARRYQAAEGAADLPAGGSGKRPGGPTGHDAGPAPDVNGFGMKLFLASLTMVFGSTFVAYAILRWRNRADWEPIVDQREIIALAVASLLLVVADIAAMRALKRVDSRARAKRLTLVTVVAALSYIVVQSISWVPLWRLRDPIDGGDLTMPGVLFLMLTFAHALHVMGGIIANAIVLLRANSGVGPTRNALRLLYQYWRFLTVMWGAVLLLLLW